jgi:hypothetical protein
MPKKIFSLSLFLLLVIYFIPSSLSHAHEEAIETESEEYRESAIRRFEIIFQISLPFTAIHSYGAVRLIEMARQNKISPMLSKNHWNIIIATTILYSGFVGLWDYLHTRGKEIHDMSRPDKSTELSLLPYAGGDILNSCVEPTLTILSLRF